MRINRFSLIELLIVIGILGALMTLVLPGFNNSSEDAKDKVARSEMREIQKAFQRFAADVIFRQEERAELNGESAETQSNEKLYDIACYGLWPLLSEVHPVLKSGEEGFIKYDSYDAETGIGRRAPYIEQEGLVYIFPVATQTYTTTNAYGQESRFFADDDAETNPAIENTIPRIPVIKDPYGGYYRVLLPAENSDGNSLNEYKRLNHMVLVCTGANRKLDTRVDSFLDKDSAHPSEIDDIVAVGDDIVIRLMPMAGF